MNKKQHKKEVKMIIKKLSKNGNHREPSLTGMPTPLTTDFAQVKSRALNTPVLYDNVDDLNVDEVLDRHTRVISISSVFLCGVTILAILRNKHFLWYLSLVLVSKVDGKNVSLNLLTNKQKYQMQQFMKEAFPDHKYLKSAVEKHKPDAFIYEFAFSEEDYERLPPAFMKLSNYRPGDKQK